MPASSRRTRKPKQPEKGVRVGINAVQAAAGQSGRNEGVEPAGACRIGHNITASVQANGSTQPKRKHISDDDEDVGFEANRERKRRVHDPKLSQKEDPNYWALQAEASWAALESLEELSLLPSFDSDFKMDFVLSGPLEEETFLATAGSTAIRCGHGSRCTADHNTLVYGRCAVLVYCNIYWSPSLRCMISPIKQCIILDHDLDEFIMSFPSPQPLLKHLRTFFDIAGGLDETFQAVYRHTVLKHPLPGLESPTKRYQCEECGRWYSVRANHTAKFPGCYNAGNTGRHFSVPLYKPTKGVGVTSLSTDYRIQVHIPSPSSINPKLKTIAPGSTSVSPVVAEGEDAPLINSWSEASFTNISGPAAPKLQVQECTDGSAGFQFSSTNRIFRCSHSHLPPPPEAPIYTGCAVLSFFQLFFSPILRAVVDPRTTTLLCKDTLRRALDSRTHGQDTNTLLKHIQDGFALLDDSEDMFNNIHKYLRLSQPVLGLPPPAEVYQCSTCLACFYPQRALVERHQSQHHLPSDLINISQTYAIRLWNNPGKKRYQAVMDTAWITAQSLLSATPARISVLSYREAAHLKDLGYEEHLKSWEISDFSILHQLFGLPSKVKTSWAANTIHERLEMYVVEIHRLLGDYLLDAERRMEGAPVVRHTIKRLATTAPLSTKESSRGKFNLVDKESLMSYRGFLTKMFAMMLRFCHLNLGRSTSTSADAAQCQEMIAKLQKFRPAWSTTQAGIVRIFVEEILRSPDPLSDLRILVFIHEFLTHLFSEDYPISQKISSVLEQTVLFLCVAEDGKWRSATWMYSILSTYFRTAKVTLLHVGVLGGLGVEYLPLRPLMGREENLAENLEDDSGIETRAFDELKEQDGEDGWQSEPDSHAHSVLRNLEKGSTTTVDDPSSQSIVHKLRSLSRMVDPGNKSSLFGRLWAVRKSILPFAKQEPLSHRTSWTDDNTTLVLSWAFIHEQRFKLDDIQHGTFHYVEKLNQALCQLSITSRGRDPWSRLSLTSFVHDNKNARSTFSVPANLRLLKPIIAAVHAAIVASIKANEDTLDSFLERSQEYLRILTIVIYLTTGVPPSASQASKLRYASSPKHSRNFVLMPGHLGILKWESEEDHTGYAAKGENSVWHIPSQVTLSLLLYLGVFRPVEAVLLADEAKRTKGPLRIDPLSTHLFCNPRLRSSAKSIIWRADDIDNTLRSGPLHMEAFPHRFLFSAILEKQHGALLRIFQQPSVIDAQGQHTIHTSQRHYGVIQLQRSTGIHFSSYKKQVLCCEAMHSFCYLAKPIQSSETLTDSMPTCHGELVADVIHRNQLNAFYTARNLVAANYSLALSTPARAAVISRMVYHQMPFLISQTTRSPPTLGDSCLLRVVLTLASGNAALMRLTVDDKSIVHLTASAAVLICAASSEWFTGHLEPYESNISLLSQGWMKLVKETKSDLEWLQSNMKAVWDDYLSRLCSEVLVEDLELVEHDGLPFD